MNALLRSGAIGPILFSMVLGTLCLLLAGCMAYDEAKSDMDFVIGEAYVPAVDHSGDFTPRRILLLPITGAIDDRYKREFITSFRTALSEEAPWTVVDWPEGIMGGVKLDVLNQDAREVATRYQCDALLFVRMEDCAIYPPLRVCVRFSMEELGTGNAVVSAFQDYDTGNKLVANAARRYYQNSLSKHATPDRSLIILNSNPPFLKYVADASANSLKKVLYPRLTATTSEK